MSDRVYTYGGADAAGNYARTDGVGSMVLRLVSLQLGSMPSNPTWGVDWESLQKIDDDLEGNAMRVIEAGLQPLVSAGMIGDISIEVTQVTEYAIGFVASYTDLTTGDAMTHAVEAAFKG